MNVAYQLTHYDKQHRLLSQTDCIPARSFVKAFLQIIYSITSVLTQDIIDIDNVSRTISGTSNDDMIVPFMTHPGLAAGDDSWYFGTDLGQAGRHSNLYADDLGIQIGTGSTAVAVADDNLITPIANGTSAGQMVYYGCYSLNYTTGASSASFDVERIFRNSSGGSIVVAEIGIYSIGTTATSNTNPDAIFGFCILRDVLGATVTVLNGEYLKVKYTITVSN